MKHYHVPSLMLLGILYCASHKKVRAHKFVELCNPNLDEYIQVSNRELKMNVFGLLEISYVFIIQLYEE